MPETLFALDADNYRDCQNMFRGPGRSEYYEGDFWIDETMPVEVRARKRTSGSCTIIETRAATRQFFRRTQRHIRTNASDLSVLWFVRKGRLKYSNRQGRLTVAPGGFLLTRSMSPFFIELEPPAGEVLDVLHMTVPTHVLRGFLRGEVEDCAALDADCRAVATAGLILAQVFEEGDALGGEAMQLLTETACRLIGLALDEEARARPPRRTLSEQRLEEVLRFIEIHLSDPNLCMAMVGEGCALSPRYLSLLLQGTGHTFSELVWSKRLEKAKEWLGRSDPRAVAISEVAYGVGFKSTAHFSRKFKQVFGLNPRDYREREGAGRSALAGTARTPHRLAVGATLQ
ncbi:helix-turn-helix transcriptional regulator [Novosphingobium mangrovi (ex Hu et al. 2023)]|uniref:AraC family transcriptional regulator n=1 Tax=Novosphingobium mangrovi (ex Hu et al. 2023) TaxID=2930094 RepID=A0ABT0AGQ2_9SPHN|nr:AraC family transcriptional regulator [Novosphingobium mangrovi (ex Hu et al. 2023)]MCJ1962357.1 AraC family transcriptional regulator [Novosphingobium mangrovi (ex Hu et al. 2023)]